MTNIRIQKLFVIGNYFFLSTNKETAKDECVITFLDNLIFVGAIHEKNIILDIISYPGLHP